MQTTQNTIVENVRSLTNKELIVLVLDLEQRLIKLEATATPARNEAQREMTDDDARRIMNGDLKDKKHKEAAALLNLSYGQVYSCRGEYTFKHIHKELKAVEGYKNSFIK